MEKAVVYRLKLTRFLVAFQRPVGSGFRNDEVMAKSFITIIFIHTDSFGRI